jgi:hypothetical protein
MITNPTQPDKNLKKIKLKKKNPISSHTRKKFFFGVAAPTTN